MTALPYTDWAVLCDHDDCMAQERTDTLELRTEATATEVRRILKRRGWAVAVPDPEGGRRRKDYCPEHKPNGT